MNNYLFVAVIMLIKPLWPLTEYAVNYDVQFVRILGKRIPFPCIVRQC